MTPNLLDELEKIIALRDAAEYENVYGSAESFAEADKAYKAGATSFIATHAPALADMAKRMEAAERDAAVIKLEAEKEFLRDWLQFIDAPNPVCCGNPTVGAEYGGMQEMVCCGSPAAEYIDLSELVTAMNGRLATIDATQEGEG